MQKSSVDRVFYGSCSGRLGLGLFPVFRVLEDKKQTGNGQLQFQLMVGTLLAFSLPTLSFSFLATKWGGFQVLGQLGQLSNKTLSQEQEVQKRPGRQLSGRALA